MDQNRITAVSDALATLGHDGIVAFDRTEPEYTTLEKLNEQYESEAYVKLIGILAGSQDYMLNGTAQQFWNQLTETAKQHQTMESPKAVRELMADFIETDINATKREQKRRRLVYLLNEGFDEWFLSNQDDIEPLTVWQHVAEGLNNPMDAQTVVLAMKIYDIAHLLTNHEYLEFPREIPLPQNRQIVRVAQSSGIVPSEHTDEVVEAWAEVIESTSDQIGEPLSLLRVDSIMFQAGQVISKHEPNREKARDALIEYFESVLLESGRADQLATELTAMVGN